MLTALWQRSSSLLSSIALRSSSHHQRISASLFHIQPQATTSSPPRWQIISSPVVLSAGHKMTWDGAGTQEDLMVKDECILVDENDAIVGHGSKYDAHRFNNTTPTGLLHRAFSVFLFDSQNRLLLQQRAASKITFPRVWTNTCCSHPLYGYQPSEIDSPEDVASGAVPGVKRAAIRKLQHELGIASECVPFDAFKFLTRLHYCARDGVEGEWGEHEVDYILFIRSQDQGVVPLNPNPEEVMATKYVTQGELREMMSSESGLLWSPWFRIIVENFLWGWWDDVEGVLVQGKHMDTETVHKIM